MVGRIENQGSWFKKEDGEEAPGIWGLRGLVWEKQQEKTEFKLRSSSYPSDKNSVPSTSKYYINQYYTIK